MLFCNNVGHLYLKNSDLNDWNIFLFVFCYCILKEGTGKFHAEFTKKQTNKQIPRCVSLNPFPAGIFVMPALDLVTPKNALLRES